jgi:hypothetical protein
MKQHAHKLSITIKANCKTQYKETGARGGGGENNHNYFVQGTTVALSGNCSPSPVGEKIACRWGRN